MSIQEDPSLNKKFTIKYLFLLFIILVSPTISGFNSGKPNSYKVGFDCSLFKDMSQTDCEALVDLYYSTGGGAWINNSGWIEQSTHPCDWYGVDCTGSGMVWVVRGLFLDSNNLVGNIPPEIGNFPSLINLRLERNQLSGVPSEIGTLHNLKYLFLDNNQLSGIIPSEIGSLTNLLWLTLDENQFNGSVPATFGNLNNLVVLTASNNSLSGSIPSGLGNLQNLAYLYLNDNQISGGIPSSFGNLLSLEVLYLFGNEINGNIPPELGNLLSLKVLYLYDNQISDGIPSSFGNLLNLEVLNLFGNEINGNIPPELGNLLNLKDLNLSFNNLSGSIPKNIGNAASLENLILTSNQISGRIPSEIGNLLDLKRLYLYYNQLSGGIPPEIGNLSNLQVLFLNHNRLNGNIPPELGNLNNLELMDLFDNEITGNIPPELSNLTNLIRLDLSDNQIGGSIPFEVGSMPSLNVFHIDNNKISGSIPNEFSNLTTLEYLDLGYNMLFTDDATLEIFLDEKDPDWKETQTIPPNDLVRVSSSPTTVDLAWTPILYTEDDGNYEVGVSTTSGGPYISIGTTGDKLASSYTITGLNPDETYHFGIRTFTPAHQNQQNNLLSWYDDEVLPQIIGMRFYKPHTSSQVEWQNPAFELTWEGVIFRNESVKIKIILSESLSELSEFTESIQIRTFSDISSPEVWKDITINSDDQLSPDGRELWLTIMPAELVSLGLLPEEDTDNTDEFISVDYAIIPGGNFEDSNAFDNFLLNIVGYERRGKGRNAGNILEDPPEGAANSSLLRAGGINYIQVRANEAILGEIRQIQNLADILYWSGHGYHHNGAIKPIDGTFFAGQSNWGQSELEIVIFSGCSVFDIKDYWFKGLDPFDQISAWNDGWRIYSPGEQWEIAGRGHTIFLGYAWSAPTDVDGSTGIIQNFLQEYYNNGLSAPESWRAANNQIIGRNAAVVDTTKNPHEYWYWHGSIQNPVWTRVQKESQGWPESIIEPITIPVNTISQTQLAEGNNYEITTAPIHGVAMISQLGLLTYTPDLDFRGNDSLIVSMTSLSSSEFPFFYSIGQACDEDLNGSNVVNLDDLLIGATYWNTTVPLADLDDNLFVDVRDMIIISNAFGSCP